MMVSDKTKDICEHLEAVSQRSIRDKLMTYFETLSSKNNSNTFTIPFTMSSLADYLSIDRSAMSRELGKMKDEGLICVSYTHLDVYKRQNLYSISKSSNDKSSIYIINL